MFTKIYFGVCIYLSVVHCILSAVTSRLFSDNFKDSKNRNIRSPMCGSGGGSNCGGFIKEVEQEFHAPVTFNTYAKSSCGNESSCEDPGGPVVPVVSNFKSGKFMVDFSLENFGLDLYYLMDATHTFRIDRQKLSEMSETFLNSVSKLSSDFQLGFGVFGDKNKINAATQEPESYGLWNKMPLTKDTTKFSSIVKNTQTVGGYGVAWGDKDQEDALTAIHQVAACTDKINWRMKTLRMLLLTTDEDFHQADSAFKDKKPFDDTCKLDQDGKLIGSEYTELNYPTLELIQNVIKANTIRVIFAIKEIRPAIPSVPDIYKTVAKKIDPMPIFITLQNNSDNIIQVIQDAYKNASGEVAIETTLKGPKETVSKTTVKSTCLTNGRPQDDSDSKIIEVDHCHVPKDKVVKLEIDVKLPCHLDTKTLHLTVNIQGHSEHKEIDISRICK